MVRIILPQNFPAVNGPTHANLAQLATVIQDIDFDALGGSLSERQAMTRVNAYRANGVVEVGMEANVDAGLQPTKFLQIPLQMVKPNYWIYGGDHPPGALTIGAAPNLQYIIWNPPLLYIHNGIFYSLTAGSLYSVTFGKYQQLTHNDIAAFVVANWDQILNAPQAHRTAFMAARLASLMMGAGTDLKNLEFQYVEVDLAVQQPTAEQLAMAEEITHRNYVSQGFTFVAARILSWAQRKHATGGTVAEGISLKVMKSARMWEGSTQDKTDLTTAFYESTHHAGPLIGLARLAAGVDTWGVFDPRPFFANSLDVLSSFSVRFRHLVPHGTAKVQDCYNVLCDMVHSKMIFLCNNQEQINEFIAHAALAKASRFKVCESKMWFYEGCPFSDDATGICVPENWNPMPGGVANIMTELACYAVIAAPSITMSASAALRSIVDQNSTPQRRAFWAQVPGLFGTAGSPDALKFFVSLLLTQKGGGAASLEMTKNDALTAVKRNANIDTLNTQLDNWYAALHLPDDPIAAHIGKVTNADFTPIYDRGSVIVDRLNQAIAAAAPP